MILKTDNDEFLASFNKELSVSSTKFLSHFLRHPLQVGAVAPSSQRLAEQVLMPVDFPNASVIVEYGPGTGVFSRLVINKMRKDSTFFAIELDETLCRLLGNQVPELTVFQGSAAEVAELLKKKGLTLADAIISGLPWACFSEQLQDEILHATVSALRDGGKFSTFAYLQGLILPSGIRFRRKLKHFFSKVELSPVVWSNLPPARVYWCTK